MYKLLRRISSSISGRFDRDRTQEEDESSTTPQTGSKRRMSDDDEEQTGSLSKRSRAHAGTANIDENGEKTETATPAEEETPNPSTSPASAPNLPRTNTEEVRQVTKGVKEVQLEDKKGKGKEVLEEPTEIKATEERSLSDKEDEGDSVPAEEPTKSDEVPKTEKVVEVEAVADGTEEDEVSQLPNDEVSSNIAVVSDTDEAPLESKTTPDAVTDAEPASELTPTDLPAENEVALVEDVVEPPVSIAYAVPPVKG